jgi:O-antigen/teichoic acid export membrane protein
MRGMGALCAFVFSVLIGRTLGVEGAGLYFLALSLTSILSVLAKMGTDVTVIRFVSVNASQKRWGMVRAVLRWCVYRVMAMSLVIGSILWLFAPLIAESVFSEPRLGEPLRLMSLAIPGFTMMHLLAGALKGLTRIPEAMLVSSILYPVFGIAMIWPLTSLMGVSGATVTYSLAMALAALAGLVFWRWRIGDRGSTKDPAPGQELWHSVRPLLVTSLINRGMLPWMPVLLLGFWSEATEVGLFAAANRVMLLVSFSLISVNAVLSPRFAAMYAADNAEGLSRLSRRFSMIVTLAALPLLLLLMFRGGWVMSIFGSDFAVAEPILFILAIGQIVNTLCGSVFNLLNMTGNERSARNCAVISMSLNLGLNFILIPLYGVIGAAIATSIATIVNNLLGSYMVWRQLDVVPMFILPSKL